MAYNINIGAGTTQQTIGIQPGTTNTTDTSLVFVGKNFPGYGQFMLQNFVDLLENFSDPVAPANALPGQLWYDSSNKALRVNRSTGPGAATNWKGLASVHIGNSAPDPTDATKRQQGDMWWDTDHSQLFTYDGAVWKLVGPAQQADQGLTGARPYTITDVSQQSHFTVGIYSQETLIGVISGDLEFEPNDSNLQSAFGTIKPGFNFKSGLLYNGDAENALSLGGVEADSYAQLSGTAPFTVAQTISSDNGLTIGSAGNVSIKGVAGAVKISSEVNNAALDFFSNIAGSSTKILSLTPGSLQTNVTITSNTALGPQTGVATKKYVDDSIISLGLGGSGGNTTFGANLVPTANVSYNLGSTTQWWDNIYGTAIHARYADVAERFEADTYIMPGTVVELGGAKEICAVGEELSENILGVISTQAAYLMNSGAGTDITHPPVAVSGRVPVRVIGPIRKGDRLVSAGNGLARAGARNEISPWNVIGRALTSKTTPGEGIIEATVKLNS
jgi:hypothetical protein